MPITVKSNDNGACIVFEGTSQPAYWYSCLRAEVDGEDGTRVNVINDLRSNGGDEYEFYKIDFQTFRDEDGNPFTDAPAVVQYINERVNPSVTTGGTTFAQTEHMDFERDATNTTVMFGNGDTHGVNSIVAVDAGDGTINIQTTKANVVLYQGLNHENLTIAGADAGATLTSVVNALNAYFTVSPVSAGGEAVLSFDVDGGTTVSGSLAEGQTPTTGTPTHLYTTAGDTSSGHGARFWSNETIDAAGEYFTVKITGQGRFILGLVDTANATDMAELSNDSGNGHSGLLWGNAFYDYGSYTAPWTTYGTGGLSYGPGWSPNNTDLNMRYNTTVQDAFDNMDAVLFKVGIDAQGYISVWYWDEGRSNDWIKTARRGQTTPSGDYALVVKLWDQNSTLVEYPEVFLVENEATYYFIESPDTSYHWPLFATAEEAEQYDTDNGGSGEHVERTFIDDVTSGRVWYSPVAGYYGNHGSAPIDTSEITWNRIHTEADQDYAPPAFSGLDVTVDELSTVNIQVTPQDVTWQTSVSFSPAAPGLSLVGTNIEGTAPEVTGNNVANPSDTITVTVTRTNNYGTSTGTFDLIVTNLTAPTTAVSGYTWEAASTPLVDSTTLDDGSVVSLDDTLQSVRRLIIDSTYVETHILPNLQEAGDKVYIGVADGAADWSTVEDADWDAYIMWEWEGTSSHYSRLVEVGGQSSTTVVSSLTNALYDYAIEVEGTDLSLIACNINAIMNEPSVVNGGSFSRDLTISSYGGTLPATIHIASVGTGCTIDENDLAEVEIPLPSTWHQVTATAHVLAFDGSATMPTLQAGYTYRFLMGDVEYKDGTTTTHLHADDDIRFTADGGTTEYTTGITRVGNPNDPGAYIEFAVPTDVPPLQWYTDHDSSLNGTTINGSTYVVSVTGITLEGPAANQTGTNLFDAPVGGSVEWGWLSLDEQLGAGERLVLDNAFLVDLVNEMPNDSMVQIGLKDGTFSNNNRSNTYSNFEGGARFEIFRYSSSDVRIIGYVPGASTFSRFTTVSGIVVQGIEIAIDLTSSGNNIRLMMTTSANSSNDVNSTAYADWNSSYKAQTGDQGYGITSVDVVMLGDGQTVGNLDQADDEFDTANVDWTGITEINVPTPAVTNTTSWTKALDFSGGSEHTKQVSNNVAYNPIAMGGSSNTVGGSASPNTTSPLSSGRPWATAVVFNPDGNNSNQHIWNYGEGAGSTDDNIYLRLDSTGKLYFGWGRSGAINECQIRPDAAGSGWSVTPGSWYGVYIGFTGERLSGANATAANLADCFDIRIMGSSNSWATTGHSDTDVSYASRWTTTGGRMDRAFAGDMTIGGRGGNRNFHGKVASMVVTTLRLNVAMPTTAEISMMIKDPNKWLTDYKVGNLYRHPSTNATATFARNSSQSARSCQVWLMGDVSGDGFAQMRNLVYPATQNETPMNMISMVSNDIQNVTISGLS